MFGHRYFGSAYFGPKYFGSAVLLQGVAQTGGGLPAGREREYWEGLRQKAELGPERLRLETIEEVEEVGQQPELGGPELSLLPAQDILAALLGPALASQPVSRVSMVTPQQRAQIQTLMTDLALSYNRRQRERGEVEVEELLLLQ